ncbi:MAG: hypothetical protein LIO42_03340 [Oscillospiraceae bacterium]|nr:hypothetical protein [Oscillospiraceae bacterium]
MGVSVGELLSGERIEEGESKDQSDKIIIESLNYSLYLCLQAAVNRQDESL